jgi:hypothetical protein
MRLGWAILGIASVLMSAGCSQNNLEVFDGCRLQAAQIYRDQSDPVDRGAASEFVHLCMQSKGYVTANDCPLNNGVMVQTSLQCYRRIYFGN